MTQMNLAGDNESVRIWKEAVVAQFKVKTESAVGFLVTI
jgi:hypothetical protein